MVAPPPLPAVTPKALRPKLGDGGAAGPGVVPRPFLVLQPQVRQAV